jgi:hypothetical protein
LATETLLGQLGTKCLTHDTKDHITVIVEKMVIIEIKEEDIVHHIIHKDIQKKEEIINHITKNIEITITKKNILYRVQEVVKEAE